MPTLRVPTTRPAPRLLLAALGLLVGLAPASYAQPQTGESATFCKTLREGVNLVSLPVLPDNPNLEALLAEVMPQIVLVQDEAGRHFVPSQDVHDLTIWEWDKTYKVVTSASGALCVHGGIIVPEASPIALASGANWVSYVRNTSSSIEEAFASIEPLLERVEDDEGRVYDPNGSSTLTTLQVGSGYKVWMSQPSAFVYPANATDGGEGFPFEVATISEALSLPDLEPGQLIHVQGYYAPGDGGGGLFEVQDSGATPDGGTVFVPAEHTSPFVTEVLPNSQHPRQLPIPAGENVVYGSLTLDLLDPDSGAPIFTFEGKHLHGHEWISRYESNLTMDYEAGRMLDRRQRLKQACSYLTGGEGWSCSLQFTYRHTTSDLRLVRQGVGEVLNADWFGARTHDDDPDFDNQPVLNHMINVADRMNAEAPGTITTIYLPKLAVYEYFGAIRLSDGLTLKGAGGTELVTVTNDLGHTYSPVRLKASHTTLRVKSNEALTHIRMSKSASDPDYLPRDAKHFLHNRRSAIYPAPNAMSVGMKDLFLDGNWEGNQQAWTEGWASNEEKETHMRNSPGWSGFVSTDHNGVPMPQGQQLTLRNVQISGFAATSVLGDANNTWTGENVRLGNALWNHAFYSANGTWTNLTFEGFAWTQAVWTAGEITNLVYEDGAPAPYRSGPDLVNIRGGDVSSQDDADGVGQITQHDGTAIELGTVIDGFYLDLRGSDISQPFNGLGPYVEIRNGIVVSREAGFSSVFQENGNGYQKALYPDYRFENITVYDNGDLNNSAVFKNLNTTNGLFRNITKTSSLLNTENTANTSMSLRANWRNNYAWEEPQINVFDGIIHESPSKFIASVSISENATGVDYFILNSRFNNTTNTLFWANGNGTLSSLTGDHSKLRVYMDDVELRLYGSYQGNLQIFFALTYFSDVTDTESGRTSEDGGTYVSTDSDRGNASVVIPTNLLWTPHEEDGEVMVSDNAGGIVSGLVFTDADGNPIGSDKRGPYLRVNLTRAIGASETVAFTWNAAVRPWPEGVTVPDYAQ